MTGFKPANLLLGKQTLYQLSYIRIKAGIQDVVFVSFATST